MTSPVFFQVLEGADDDEPLLVTEVIGTVPASSRLLRHEGCDQLIDVNGRCGVGTHRVEY